MANYLKNMRTIILLLLFFSTELFAQQKEEWIYMLENPKYPRFSELKPENFLSKYVEYDFSKLLNPKSEILGFIGSEYRRIKVSFNSIRKSKTTPNLYFVTGETTVNKNTCDFEGTIIIEQVREFENMHYGVDEMYIDAGMKAQGLIISRYLLSENPQQKHVGIFDGIMTLWWYLDKNNEIQYDDLNTQSDSYKNNQYIGNWTEYGKSNGRLCNWGESRIPFSGDLDIGAGEFFVNPDYRKNGWEDYN